MRKVTYKCDVCSKDFDGGKSLIAASRVDTGSLQVSVSATASGYDDESVDVCASCIVSILVAEIEHIERSLK